MSSEWKSPTTIIAFLGLLVSVSGNIIQYRQNVAAEAKIQAEQQRAYEESSRANHLQDLRDAWLRNKDEELRALNAQIKEAEFGVQVAAAGVVYHDPMAYQVGPARANYLASLQAKKESLEKEKADFLKSMGK